MTTLSNSHAHRAAATRASGLTISSLFQLRRKKYLILSAAFLVDAVLLVAALFAANLVFFDFKIPHVNFAFYEKFLAFYLVAKLAALFVYKLYNDSAFETKSMTMLTIIEFVVVTTLLELVIVTSIIFYLDPNLYRFSRGALLTKGILELLFLGAWRVGLILAIQRFGWLQHRSVIAGMTREGLDVVRARAVSPYRRIVGYVDHDRCAELSGGLAYLGTPREISDIMSQYKIDELIVTGERELKAEVINAVNNHSVSIKVLPRDLETISTQLATCEINDVPFVEVNSSNLSLSTMAIKRLSDIGFAAGGLLIASPMMAFLWVWYRLFHGGDLIYTQPRVGRDGREFTVYKIRTMVKDAESQTGAVICHGRDTRVLRIGWVLRRTHLDELPQLWNILLGDMSLVGPRPERPERVAAFAEQNPSYNLRHIVRPGLTGLAQVKGKYDSHFEYKLFYDLLYAFNVSTMLDLKILYMTPKYIFGELFGEKNQY
jgi:exopolysaccharide biosynthesis polyprenyl glycosylphosphotransferase